MAFDAKRMAIHMKGAQKLKKQNTPIVHLYSVYKHRAKKLGVGFSIPKTLFMKLVTSNCHYCGCRPCTPKYAAVRKRRDDLRGSMDRSRGVLCNGIDRVNNELGYIESNCVPCCKICNQAKLDRSIEEFEAWIERLINHKKAA